MLSPGAETFTRLPNPLEKPSVPLYRVSVKAFTLARLALAGSCGFAEKMSSSVVAPTSIAPLSGIALGTVVEYTLSRGEKPVVTAFVGALPPDGPTAAAVTRRVPSFAAMQTTTFDATIPATTPWAIGSSSRYRPGKPKTSAPKPMLTVMTLGAGTR